MKKMLLTAAIAALGIFGANAQEIEFGAKAGVNFANVGGDSGDTDMRTGLHIGALVEIPFSDKFSFQPELLYSMQGAKIEESETFMGETYSYEENNKLNYLNVPLMIKFYATEGFSIEAGPQVGFLMSAETEFEESFDGETESETIDTKDLYSSIDFGLNFGVSYELDMGVFFSARYYLGLANIIDSEGGMESIDFEDIEDIEDLQDQADDLSIQNNVIQVSVGYKF